ncbi:MAG: tetratricopeptide repeat protein [Chitinophagaceae bacterium]|nr:MAG: tetratricopeptide repeat protein [Chitinophagaceae bacterium]
MQKIIFTFSPVILIMFIAIAELKAEEDKIEELLVTYNNALDFLNTEDFESALPLLTEVIRSSPSNSDLMHLALSHRGSCYYELNQYFLAVNDFNAALFVNVKENIYHNSETTEFLTEYINGINYFLSGSAKQLTGSQSAACADWLRSRNLGERRADEMIRKYCQ